MYTLTRRIYIRSMPMLNLAAKIFGRDIYTYMYGKKVYYDPKTDVGNKILRVGNFERAELAFIGKLLKEDSVTLDIGANIGTHSLFIANTSTKGKVFSFEPSHDTYHYLLKNTAGTENIFPINAAASDTSGTSTFNIAEDNAYSGIQNTGKRPIIRVESVMTLRVDDFADTYNLEKIDLIKIDVEGHEEQAINGAVKTILRYKPALLIEITEGAGSTLDAGKLISTIERLGYTSYVMHGWDIAPFQKHDNAFQNYVFLPKGTSLPK